MKRCKPAPEQRRTLRSGQANAARHATITLPTLERIYLRACADCETRLEFVVAREGGDCETLAVSRASRADMLALITGSIIAEGRPGIKTAEQEREAER